MFDIGNTMLASSDRDEAQIRRFISAIDVAAYVTDSDGSLVAYNEAAERLWGAKPQDGARCFIGVGEITTPDGARLSYDQSSAAQCARSDRPVRGQKLLLGGLDARPVAVEAASLPLRCSPDHGSYVVTTITRVVPEAFATFAHYRAALEHSPLVPWIADAAGLLIRAEVSGFASQENARGLGRSWIDFVDPVDRAVVSDAWQVSIGSGTSLDVEFRVWQSGVVQWCRGRAVARRDEHDDIIAWYGSIENIHDRKVAIIALKDSEQRALSILQNSPASMRMLELDGTTIFLNEMSKDVARTFAYDANLGARWQDDLPAAYWAEGSLAIERAAAGHRSTMTIRATVDGTFRWWNVTVAPVLGVDGLPVEILTIAHDITEQTNAMAALELAKAEAEIVAGKLMTVLESTTDNVVVIDRDYRVAYVNDNAARLIGGSRCQPGISVFEMFGEGGGAFVDHLQEACDKGTAVTFESCMSGLGLRLEVRVFPSDTGSSIFFRDVSDRHRADEERRAVEERMSQMALRDALTGLANRTLFQQALEAALHGGDRLGTAMFFIDLDRFKDVNDTYGHLVGDQLLCLVAERLRRSTDVDATVARLGGDEFAVVQTGVASADSAAQIAGRLIEVISEPYRVGRNTLMIGASVGVALASAGLSAEEVLRRSDSAMYRAKASSRGTCRVYSQEMDEALKRRQELRVALGAAVSRGEMALHYQPLVELESNRIIGFEALLRWHHPGYGWIPPVEIVPILEECGLIIPIGDWALRTACRNAATWPDGVGVAVNLSAAQFASGQLVNSIATVLAVSGLDPARLELEITESILLQDSDTVLRCLHALRQLGVRIAMDDFGTGYSSLNYLRKFPFNSIKIDQSFVADVASNREAEKIVRFVLDLGRSLNLATTAEGVETSAQSEWMFEMGCTNAQGYLYSPPMPASAIPDFIAKHSSGTGPSGRIVRTASAGSVDAP